MAQATGEERWSWQAPDGALAGSMIVTDTHLLASSATHVYALDLATRQAVWSYPAGGQLALGNGTLYVASSSGTLTAITMPEVVPSPLVRLEVAGLSEVVESSSAAYFAEAHYKDGRVRDRTLSSAWSVAPETYAAIGLNGVLATAELLQPFQDVVVRARYTEGGQTVEATRTVRLRIGVSIAEFARRNLAASIDLKRRLLSDLEAALARERAVLSVLAALPPTPRNQRRVDLLADAIAREERARAELIETLERLREAQALQPDADPAPAGIRGPTRRTPAGPS